MYRTIHTHTPDVPDLPYRQCTGSPTGGITYIIHARTEFWGSDCGAARRLRGKSTYARRASWGVEGEDMRGRTNCTARLHRPVPCSGLGSGNHYLYFRGLTLEERALSFRGLSQSPALRRPCFALLCHSPPLPAQERPLSSLGIPSRLLPIEKTCAASCGPPGGGSSRRPWPRILSPPVRRRTHTSRPSENPRLGT